MYLMTTEVLLLCEQNSINNRLLLLLFALSR